MKNILYVGPYHQNDGWGYAAREYLRALVHTENNIVSRPVYLNNQSQYNYFSEFKTLEDKKINNFDVIIQHGLPHLFKYYGGVLNVGIGFFETDDIKSTPWVPYLNLMDQIWVSSHFERQCLLRSGVVNPGTFIIPIPCEQTKYEKRYEFEDLDNHKNEYKFYFIGEYSTRKNVNSLLLAFYREFHNSEQVRLVLKLNKVGVDPSLLLEQIKRDIYNFNHTHKIYQKPDQYKEVVIIPTYLSEERLYGLHQSCQCFVAPSYGEAFCIPAFDAMMFNNDVLVNKNSGMSDYIIQTDWLIDSTKVPAIALDRPLPYLYTGKDSWYNISVDDLQGKMRKCYNNRNNKTHSKTKQESKEYTAKQYTYQFVADKISSVL